MVWVVPCDTRTPPPCFVGWVDGVDGTMWHLMSAAQAPGGHGGARMYHLTKIDQAAPAGEYYGVGCTMRHQDVATQ